MATIRESVVAGQFYPGTRSGLEKALAGLTKKAAKESALGAMSPHAGYVYSGGVAGKVLSRLAEREVFIIIGPNHTGRGAPFSVFPDGKWRTPLGDVDVDKDMVQSIIKNSGIFKADESAHEYEHSVEVQIPFLQYLFKDFKIVPIIIGSTEIATLKKAGRGIAGVIKETKKSATIIASSDMTHYEARQTAEAKDKAALSAILNLDEDGLAEKVISMDISMCGVGPVILMLSAVKELGAKRADLVDYKTSGDASGDYSSVVGYGGVIIT
jgi:AmmeMemoRadiSam system protein B